jgi:uncharacterized protein (TIGR03437 family)
MGRSGRNFAIVFSLLWPAGYALADLSSGSTPPVYTAASIVGAASQVSGTIAPNSIVTVYGANLSWNTSAVTSADLEGRDLPESLGGVTVYVNHLASGIFYVSPSQVNFIVPYNTVGSTATIYLVRDGASGPHVTLPMATAAPGLFEWNGNFALAQHADGSLITEAAPAHSGEIVVLYATGLGRTSPDLFPGSYSDHAAVILYLAQLQVRLNGVACAAADIYYAGVTPGFAGLYQINLRLPAELQSNPSIQVVMGDQASPASVQLFAE